MTTDTTTRALLQLLVNHEMRLNAFYRECARQLPEEDDFWQALAEAESGHAHALAALLALAETGTITVRDGAIHRATLDAFNRYIAEQTRIISHGGLTLSMLLSIALDVEQTTLEQDPLSYFTGAAPELPQTRATLQAETRQHVETIRARLAQVAGGR